MTRFSLRFGAFDGKGVTRCSDEQRFQASIFSNDYAEIMEAINRLDASALMVNEHSAFRVDWMPFAGRKRSGLGVGGISHTIEEMSQSKMAVLSSN